VNTLQLQITFDTHDLGATLVQRLLGTLFHSEFPDITHLSITLTDQGDPHGPPK
jgi:hypothetical protein